MERRRNEYKARMRTGLDRFAAAGFAAQGFTFTVNSSLSHIVSDKVALTSIQSVFILAQNTAIQPAFAILIWPITVLFQLYSYYSIDIANVVDVVNLVVVWISNTKSTSLANATLLLIFTRALFLVKYFLSTYMMRRICRGLPCFRRCVVAALEDHGLQELHNHERFRRTIRALEMANSSMVDRFPALDREQRKYSQGKIAFALTLFVVILVGLVENLLISLIWLAYSMLVICECTIWRKSLPSRGEFRDAFIYLFNFGYHAFAFDNVLGIAVLGVQLYIVWEDESLTANTNFTG